MKKFSVAEAVEKRRIIPFSNGPKLARKELEAAEEDLLDARDLFSRGRFKSATTLSYYSIFHTGRALLYMKKYREKSHIQLIFAIKEFYIDTGIISKDYYDDFIQALDLREMADYKREYSKSGAERNIEAADEAVKAVEKVLKG